MIGKWRALTAHFGKKQTVAAIVALALAAAAALAAWALSAVCDTLVTQKAAEAWQGESQMRFAQISVFQPTDAGLQLSDIETFRQTLQAAMTDASLTPDENGSLFADAFSCSANLSVSSHRAAAEVPVIGVGGDYFLFHPLRLRSGSYLTSTDAMRDRVILDEELAWTLFGSTDVAGMSVTIGEKTYPIAGVVCREDDFANREAYTAGAGMFICYEALSEMMPTEISCYELVVPDVVSGFGANLVREKFPVEGGVVVENSARYDFAQLLQVIGDFGTRSMSTHGVVYPYWENAARMTEDYAAALLLLLVITALFPAVCIAVTLVRLAVRLIEELRERLGDEIERRTEARKEKNYVRKGI